MKTEVEDVVSKSLSDKEVLDLLNQFSLNLLNQNTVEEVMGAVIHDVIAKLNFLDCVIYIWDEEEDALIQHTAYGKTLKDDGAEINILKLRLEHGVVGRAAREKTIQLIENTELDPDYVADGDVRLSELSVPMLQNGNLIGVIDSEHPEPSFYTEQHVKLLSTLASMVAVKLVQAKYFDELTTRQSHLDLIHDNTNDLIFLLSVEKNNQFRYLSANESYRRILGVEPGDIVGKTVDEAWPPNEATYIKKYFSRVVEEKSLVSYRFFTDSAKGRVEVQSKLNPICDKNGNVIKIAGVALNLSEIKAKDRDLQETRDQYKILFDSSPDAILINDMENIIDVNHAFLEMFGYSSKEEVIGQKSKSLVALEDIELINAKRDEAKSGKPVHIPCIKVKRNDGRIFFAESYMAQITIKGKKHLQVITRDITERIKNENVIRSSRERLQTATNLVELGSFEWSLLHKELIWDDQLCRIFECNEQQDYAQKIKYFHKILYQEDQSILIKSFEDEIDPILSDNIWGCEFRIEVNGQIKHLKSLATLLRDEKGNIIKVIGSCTDFTRERVIEQNNNKLLENLKKSEDKFRSFFENALDPILLSDKKNGFIDCNRAALRMFGVKSKQEMMGKRIDDFSPKYQPDGLLSVSKRKVMNKIGYSNRSNRFEWSLFNANNAILSVEVNMASIQMDEKPTLLIHLRDITLRKESEEGIKRSEERLRQVIDLVPYYIFAKDLNGKFLLVNQAVADEYNSTTEALIGKTDADFLTDKAEADIFRKQDVEVINSQKPLFEVEDLLTSKNGDRRIMSTTKIPFSAGHTDTPSVLGISIDITDKVKKQEELKELLRVTNDQNARLQNFAHIVSHDIRSHSANISSLVNFIGKSSTDQEKNIMLGMLRTSTEKLDETISNLNEIVSVNRRLNLPTQNLNLSIALRNTLHILNPEIIQSGIDVSINLSGNEYIKVVPAYLNSILLNLVSNAIKYRDKAKESFLEIYTERVDNYLVMCFKDNGLGLDTKRNKGKLFGMYKTFHTNDDARGFGLFITKNQIEAMRGEIKVESQLGEGSIFKVYFNEEY